jgi:hypothetical protein
VDHSSARLGTVTGHSETRLPFCVMLRLSSQRPSVGVGVGTALAACTVAGLAACSTSSPATHEDHATPAAETQAAAAHEVHANAAQQASTSAVDLRAQLEQYLGQHAILTVRLTRARLRDDGDLAQTADAALSKNTQDMGALIETVYGADAAEEFEGVWFDHVTYLFDYARGVAENDPEVQAEAVEGLDGYLDGLSTFLAEATNDALPASTVHHELQMHVDQLIQQTDAYAAGDYVRAFELERQSYAHMFPLGKTLAAGIVTGTGATLPEDFDSPARQMQSQLGMALGEHAELAVDAMRSGLAGQPDFTAAAGALDTNTREITGVIESIFGAEAATAFQALWADHIDAFVGYTTALASGDEALETQSRARLEQFNASFSAFLATAVQDRLGASSLDEAFVAHEDFLLRQIDSYAARDYSTAHELSFDAYQHMFALAAQLSTAIGDTVAARSPEGGMQTGLGGTAAIGRR